MDLISLSIPAFFVLIGVELLVAHLAGRTVYRFSDSVTDLSCGILNQVVALFTAGGLLALYVLVYEHLRLFDLPGGSPWTWLLAILGIDLTYYAFHRACHERNLLWVLHSPHHQSEEYNLTVALRQGAFEPLGSIWFRLPLALLGLPPVHYVTANALNTLYQFWVHTRLVGRLGPLEAVLVTPSHHRVHHGCDPEYLDRNYSGMFIVWDRLFGTFRREEAEPTYGVVKPVASWNPVWANLEHVARVLAFARTRTGLLRKWALWWEAPTVLPGRDAEGRRTWAPQPVRGRAKYDLPVPGPLRRWVLGQLVVVAGILLVLLLGGSAFGGGLRIALALWVAASVLAFGGLLEERGWARPLEAARLSALPFLAWSALLALV